MTRYPAPVVPYVGPAAHTTDGPNKPIARIVIHSTVSPCEAGGARKIGAYFRSQTSGGSAHYIVDPGEVVQSVFDGVIAWHAPPNQHSIGIEMCDMPGPPPSRPMSAAWWRRFRKSWRWARPAQARMLERTAKLTAQLCLAYDVPAVYVDAAGLRAGRRGITTHNEVSTAFEQSTHWDPGVWPRRSFVRMVRAEVKRLRKESE